MLIHAQTAQLALVAASILTIAASFMSVTVALFVYRITTGLKSNWIIHLGYGISFAYALSAVANRAVALRPIFEFRYYTVAEPPMYHVFTAGFFFYLFYGIYLLIKAIRTADPLKRNQFKYILIALASGYISGIITFLPAYRVPVQPIPTHFVWMYAVIISYAIVQHQLMDIKVIIKKSMAYVFWVLLVSVPYFALVMFTHGLASGSISIQSWPSFFALSSLACAVLAAGLTVFSLVYGTEPVHRLFAIFNAVVALWGASCFYAAIADDVSSTIMGWALALEAGLFIAPVFYHLILRVCRVRRSVLLTTGYAQAVIFGLLFPFYPWEQLKVRQVFDVLYVQSTPLTTTSIICYMIFVFLSFKELWQHRRNGSAIEILQKKYILSGFLVGFVGGTTILLPELGIDLIYPMGNALICGYALILAYAIFKHRLLDIHIVIRKTVFYTAFLTVISAAYVGIIYLLHLMLFSKDGADSFALSFISILVIAAIFKPIEIAFNGLVEKRFFKGTISQIAEQKERLETELERGERLKSVGILAAGMAHEIKNPITAINTFVEYLPKKYDDPDFREKFLRIVSEETTRIKSIVSDLLAFSKPQTPRKELCDASILINSTLELLSSDLIRRQIEVRVSCAKNVPLYADPHQIKQALLNILMNAMEAMATKEGGRLTVESAEVSSNCEITISDTGEGIAPDRLPHIFDPFYTNKDYGTGLGLAITHSLIASNGGRIEVLSSVGKGTTFKIFVPAKVSLK